MTAEEEYVESPYVVQPAIAEPEVTSPQVAAEASNLETCAEDAFLYLSSLIVPSSNTSFLNIPEVITTDAYVTNDVISTYKLPPR